ncbi:uncharacterized protein LOC123677394 isoform X1 [Harmonia axyridis]|uniref:uncharacterized protein LOC123677394 isoform X1 n=1 Tax=Harmonia axyridis TaxID=115357 RepID=UPI001E277E51|nr:uncharacterized protein LOC123677394 isoform X1 [Harmonia axyridis]
MERNTYGESCSLQNDQPSHISLTAKQGLMDIRTPLGISAIEIGSWSDLEDEILKIFNNRVSKSDKDLFILYENKLFSGSPISSSVSLCGDDDDIYEEIVQTLNFATQQEAEVVILPDDKAWRRMWKCFKKVLKMKKGERE